MGDLVEFDPELTHATREEEIREFMLDVVYTDYRQLHVEHN